MNSPILHQAKPKITSIESYKLFGITKNKVRFLSINEFHIDKEYKHCFENYVTYKWKTSYTLENIKEGILTREGKSYIVVFHKTTRYAIKQSEDCMLSFRQANEAYDLPAFVLIKPSKP